MTPQEFFWFVVALGVVLLAGIFGVIFDHRDTTSEEIAALEQSAINARADARDAQAKTAAVNAHIAAAEAAAFEDGRRAAEAEWREYTRYD
jgi:hypothetical protein